MKIWTDKSGKKIDRKEFIERFKKGVQGITPQQQIKFQLQSTNIIIIGILFGIMVSFIAFEKMWWVLIILVGALGNTIMQWIGLWQKKKMFDNIYNSDKEVLQK